jgi:hypothetical protein
VREEIELMPPDIDPGERYFVHVIATDAAALRRLQGLGLDLFRVTAREEADGRASIEGLVRLADVASLVHLGYEVHVYAEASARTGYAAAASEFPQWLQDRTEQASS